MTRHSNNRAVGPVCSRVDISQHSSSSFNTLDYTHDIIYQLYCSVLGAHCHIWISRRVEETDRRRIDY